ncbi:MAG: hypothetical protein AAGA30_11730, partial [Planctomycetota bacterium]
MFIWRTQIRWFYSGLAAVLFCQAASFGQLNDDRKGSESDQLIQGLSSRTLFDLVDAHVEQQLDDNDLDQLIKCEIVLAAIQSKTEQATISTGEDREKAWQAIRLLVRNFQRDFPNHPQKILVSVQDSLADAAHGRLIQQEVAAEIQGQDAKATALDLLRQATSKFTKLERAIEKQLPSAPVDSKNGQLTRLQLTNLKNNVRYQLAVINLSKAELYESSERLNQMDALNQVLERLQSVLTQSNPDVPLWWNAQISRLHCLRLKKDWPSASKVLASLPETELSDELIQKLLTERVLLAVEHLAPNQWTELMKEYAEMNRPSPLLQLAILKMSMATATRADSEAEKKKWQAMATNLVGEVELIHGPYWGRRAEILLVGSVGATTDSPASESDLQILIRQGDSAFRKQNYADARKAFSKALTFASQSSNGKQSLSLA